MGTEPGYADIGPKLDRFVVEHLSGRRVALRGVYLTDHRDKSREEMISIIQRVGTDLHTTPTARG